MARYSILLLLYLVFQLTQVSLSAQSSAFVAGELLVQMEAEYSLPSWLRDWNRTHADQQQLTLVKEVSRPVNIWLVSFDEMTVSGDELIMAIRSDRRIRAVQHNHSVTLRAVPTDALFDSQWQYSNTGQSGGTIDADIDAVEAWDVTTGGNTLTGDTIVVAVLDNGIDVTHPDFQANRWYNHAEIPDNGLDDDNNGYVDDYEGWSTVSNNDNIAGGSHGTAVSGIIGADGNNELGVTGVNWHVKVMHIRNNFNSSEDKVIEAYSYALEQRQRYNASGGAEGAFVVATNASWGVDEGQVADAPIWCGFYDVLGEAGIINCAATANDDIDVEVFGDLPTACPSDYLIAVTNTDHNDIKEVEAGYGAISIDLGAPGTGAYNITNGGAYGGFGGTSGATPHVAGTAALLYSLDCPALSALTAADPAAAALLIKEAILAGVDPNTSLAGITTTGGRLNVANSIQYLLSLCDGCIPASSVQLADFSVSTATIVWNTNDSLESVDLRWRAIGEMNWTLVTDAQSPLVISGLTACGSYEYQVQSNCASDVIPFGNSRFFTTDGCCTAPENVELTPLADEIMFFVWDAVTAAQSFELRYRVQGTSPWTVLSSTLPQNTISGLERCTIYDYQLRTVCADEVTAWTALTTFITGGCGPCLDLDYCMPENVFSTQYEHIAQVEIGGFFTNASSEESGGYTDFGQLLVAPVLEAGVTYPILLTPGFPDTGSASEDWRIWLDLDHNGSFTTNEIIFDGDPSSDPINEFITIPANTNLGVTRMRIMMQFSLASSGPCPFVGSFGEIEDYCIEVIAPEECASPVGFARDLLGANSVEITWEAVPGALDYQADYRSAGGVDWLPVMVTGNQVLLSGLDSCAAYTLRVKTLCNGSESESYSFYDFNTCLIGGVDLLGNEKNWVLAPNPFRDQLEVRALNFPTSGEMTLAIIDGLGRPLMKADWPIGQGSSRINMTDFPAGLYTVALYRDGQLWSVKRAIKQ
ncbi:S8 family serine peptidase [Lewinella cohaerens]|uniref:S8 family serine peptidase n=1 Tax=Lewinella cohaerens TaxID=70995 RepID=UPI000361A2C8|nr:S8 family serine peptidase [Lewinella cohaerens]